MFARQNSSFTSGFTLLELLIVIAIIAVLMTITVLAVGTTPRDRAENVKTNESMRQIFLAIEQYKTIHGTYPYSPSAESTCLGDYADDLCGRDNAVSEDPTLMAEIQTVYPHEAIFPGVNFSKYIIFGFSIEYYFEGPTYRCYESVGSRCDKYQLEWMVNSFNINDRSECAFGLTKVDGAGSEYRHCKYTNVPSIGG